MHHTHPWTWTSVGVLALSLTSQADSECDSFYTTTLLPGVSLGTEPSEAAPARAEPGSQQAPVLPPLLP